MVDVLQGAASVMENYSTSNDFAGNTPSLLGRLAG